MCGARAPRPTLRALGHSSMDRLSRYPAWHHRRSATVVQDVDRDRDAHGLLEREEGIDQTHQGRDHPVGLHGRVVVGDPELHAGGRGPGEVVEGGGSPEGGEGAMEGGQAGTEADAPQGAPVLPVDLGENHVLVQGAVRSTVAHREEVDATQAPPCQQGRRVNGPVLVPLRRSEGSQWVGEAPQTGPTPPWALDTGP